MGEHIVLVYLVVCFFVFLAGFVDSIAGGGGLISLPAYMIVGLPAHTAIATIRSAAVWEQQYHLFIICVRDL